LLITTDRTNFPLVVVEDAAVEVHLLPITKVQFNGFVSAPAVMTKERYQEMLAANPSTTPEEFTGKNREQLFITGIRPEEAIAFARWLGEDFDLPTVKEWRNIMAALRREPPPRRNSLLDVVEGPARAILEKLEAQLHIRSMLDYSLMRGGLVEWVRHDEALVGLGVPRPEFHPNLWEPLVDEIKPIDIDERVPYFGCRLVRRGEWYLADKENAKYVF
jgi:hypothetical protein